MLHLIQLGFESCGISKLPTGMNPTALGSLGASCHPEIATPKRGGDGDAPSKPSWGLGNQQSQNLVTGCILGPPTRHPKTHEEDEDAPYKPNRVKPAMGMIVANSILQIIPHSATPSTPTGDGDAPDKPSHVKSGLWVATSTPKLCLGTHPNPTAATPGMRSLPRGLNEPLGKKIKKIKKRGKKEKKKGKRGRGSAEQEQSVTCPGLLGALHSYHRTQPPSAGLICLFFIKQIR